MSRVTAGATSTAAEKARLRGPLRARRAARAAEQDPADRHTDAVAVADAVVGALRRRHGEEVCRVAAYVARPTEPPTGVLLHRLLALGYDVVVPVTLADRDLDWAPAGHPTAAHLGLDAIAGAALVVVPALAVDGAGHRLGQGGGSYDRALPRRSAEAVVVALVHDDERLDGVPVDAHDVGVDAVVTPGAGWVSLSPRG
jgi:5-formyltetrahydrofolate cyclo-ligase